MFGILAYPSPLSVTCRNHFRAKNKPWLDFWDASHSLETVCRTSRFCCCFSRNFSIHTMSLKWHFLKRDKLLSFHLSFYSVCSKG